MKLLKYNDLSDDGRHTILRSLVKVGLLESGACVKAFNTLLTKENPLVEHNSKTNNLKIVESKYVKIM